VDDPDDDDPRAGQGERLAGTHLAVLACAACGLEYVETTRYHHECPVCGSTRVTHRLTSIVKWARDHPPPRGGGP